METEKEVKTRKRRVTKPKVGITPLVEQTLHDIPDSLIVRRIKEKDEALTALITQLSEWLETRSQYPDITPATRMGKVKEILSSIPHADQVKLLNNYTDIRFENRDAHYHFEKRMSIIQKYSKPVIIIVVSLIVLIWLIMSMAGGHGVDGTVLGQLLKVFTEFFNSSGMEILE